MNGHVWWRWNPNLDIPFLTYKKWWTTLVMLFNEDSGWNDQIDSRFLIRVKWWLVENDAKIWRTKGCIFTVSHESLFWHLYGRYSFNVVSRPRPSPFERPSTRYNGISPPWWGEGFRLQDFGPRRGVDFRVFGFSGAKRPKRHRRRRNRKFWIFFENFTKLMYLKSTKIAFQLHFVRTHFCARTLKNLQISDGRSKSTFERPDAQFCAKKVYNCTNNA